jgi:hypothetical protein
MCLVQFYKYWQMWKFVWHYSWMHIWLFNVVILIYNIIITMARLPSIGAWASSFRGYEVFVHFAAVRDRPTAALFNSILMWLPEPSGSQSGDLGEKWPLEFSLRTLLVLLHARKVLLHAVNLRHRTDGFTSPPKEVVLRIFITLKNPST